MSLFKALTGFLMFQEDVWNQGDKESGNSSSKSDSSGDSTPVESWGDYTPVPDRNPGGVHDFNPSDAGWAAGRSVFGED